MKYLVIWVFLTFEEALATNFMYLYSRRWFFFQRQKRSRHNIRAILTVLRTITWKKNSLCLKDDFDFFSNSFVNVCIKHNLKKEINLLPQWKAALWNMQLCALEGDYQEQCMFLEWCSEQVAFHPYTLHEQHCKMEAIIYRK